MAEDTRPTVALVYDFDGTLSPLNMQEYDFLKAIGVEDSSKFWEQCNSMARKYDASDILCYMKLMLDKARAEGVSVRREQFVKFGASVELFPGVEQWFEHIDKLGEKQGVNIQHYINSSGLQEMIDGTSIRENFKQVYACTFMYVDGVAQWPAVAVDFTTKTQFLFMINKGINRISNNKQVNEFRAEADRPVPFRHMIYFGDGETDIPCMKMVKLHGGHSIAVYNPARPAKRKAAEGLVRDDRVNFVSPADYTKGGELYRIVEAIIKKVKFEYEFKQMELANQRSILGE